MEPIALWVQPNGEWTLIHRCRDCGLLRANRIAGDDSELLLVSLAVRALARPAFPLETVVGALESPPGDSAAYPGPRVERE